jgi:predicted nucleotidyltransferase
VKTLKENARTAGRQVGSRRSAARRRTVHWGDSPAISQLVDRMVRRIVRRFHPDKIILFGSQARGTPAPDSDVDLLIILPVERERKAQMEIEIGCALHSFAVPKDVLVVSPDEFERRREIVGTIPYEAARDGRILYARPVRNPQRVATVGSES